MNMGESHNNKTYERMMKPNLTEQRIRSSIQKFYSL